MIGTRPAIVSAKGANGLGRLNTTVRSSGAFTSLIGSPRTIPGEIDPAPFVKYRNVNATSRAVSGRPSCHVMASRSVNVQVRPSSLVFQDFASHPIGSPRASFHSSVSKISSVYTRPGPRT